MVTKRAFRPVTPIHPGEMLLEDLLRPVGKTQKRESGEAGGSGAARAARSPGYDPIGVLHFGPPILK
jgi:hypothetical protein